MTWENGQVKTLIIRSGFGNNMRLCLPNEPASSDHFELTEATGENANPFYQSPSTKQPLVQDKAALPGLHLKDSFTYDIQTVEGNILRFQGK